MKKIFFTLLLIASSISLIGQTDFYSFTVTDINGKEFDFSQLKGKKVLIVNTASKCGFTPQYAQLEEVYRQYQSKGLVVIAFPANNFMNQEPGSNSEIKEFCTEKYEVSFPVMAKISVKGEDMHPVYKWLTSKSENGVSDSSVSWNFQKYLIDEHGKLIRHFVPKMKPNDAEILSYFAD